MMVLIYFLDRRKTIVAVESQSFCHMFALYHLLLDASKRRQPQHFQVRQPIANHNFMRVRKIKILL